MSKITDRVGEQKGVKRPVALLLDSSLISQSKIKKYDLKIIQCGDYFQVYKYNNIKVKIDKTLVIDKVPFVIHCDNNKYIQRYVKDYKTGLIIRKYIVIKDNKQELSQKQKEINKEYDKYYNNILYDFKKNSNFVKSINKIDTDNLIKLNSNNKEKNKIIDIKNINRSKFELQRLVKSNIDVFKTFITLTFEDNINNIEFANKKFNIWKTYIKQLKNDFKYICVPEFQKRGAVHYHLLTNIDYNDENLLSIEERKIWNKKSGWQIGKDVKGWKYGINMAKKLDNINVIGYITKYMTKDIDNRLWGKRRYLYSYNLIRPKTIYLDTNNLNELIKYFDILDYDLQYSNTYISKFNDIIDFKEYKKMKI